jgi:hypothetical protein
MKIQPSRTIQLKCVGRRFKWTRSPSPTSEGTANMLEIIHAFCVANKGSQFERGRARRTSFAEGHSGRALPPTTQ